MMDTSHTFYITHIMICIKTTQCTYNTVHEHIWKHLMSEATKYSPQEINTQNCDEAINKGHPILSLYGLDIQF